VDGKYYTEDNNTPIGFVGPLDHWILLIWALKTERDGQKIATGWVHDSFADEKAQSRGGDLIWYFFYW
jgi:hypothetical protein